jgi:hypothetical protein
VFLAPVRIGLYSYNNFRTISISFTLAGHHTPENMKFLRVNYYISNGKINQYSVSVNNKDMAKRNQQNVLILPYDAYKPSYV